MGLAWARTGPLVLARSSTRAFLKCGASAFQKRHWGPFRRGPVGWGESRSAPDFSPIWGIFINFERKSSIFNGFRRFSYQNATKPAVGLARARTGPLVLARSTPRAFLECRTSAFLKRHRGPFGGDLWAGGRGSRSAPDFSPIWGIFINFEKNYHFLTVFGVFPIKMRQNLRWASLGPARARSSSPEAPPGRF